MAIDLSDPIAVSAAIDAWARDRAERGLPRTPASLRAALGISQSMMTTYGKMDMDNLVKNGKTENMTPRQACDRLICEALNSCGASMEDYYMSKDVKHDVFGKSHLVAVGEWSQQADQAITVTFVGVDDVPD